MSKEMVNYAKTIRVRDVVVKLPPGFRFHPTDEEIVLHYLKNKVLSKPLPASVIPEFNVWKSDPWDLPGDEEQKRYFFSPGKAKNPDKNRSTFSGYWKLSGNDKEIVTTESQQVVGMKKTFIFYRGKAPSGCKTEWIMHQFRIANIESMAEQENWVVCCIFNVLKNKTDDHEESSS